MSLQIFLQTHQGCQACPSLQIPDMPHPIDISMYIVYQIDFDTVIRFKVIELFFQKG